MRIRQLLWLAVWLLSEAASAAPVRPLSFEQRPGPLFLGRASEASVGIRADRIVLGDVTLRFLGARRAARMEGVGPAAPATYITHSGSVTFRQFARLAVRQVYRGVDVLFYGSQDQLEYDLNVAPGVSFRRIRLQVDGARGLRLDGQGNLLVETGAGVLRQLAPHVFEERNGVRWRVPARYVLLAGNRVGFRAGRHDSRLPLTIDPVLVFAKYFGGGGLDAATAVATDNQGNVYVAGSTNSVDFPATGGFQSRLTPPLLALSNQGQTITKLTVGDATSVQLIGGTPDGKVLYLATTTGIFVSNDAGSTFHQASPFPSQPGSSASVPLSVSEVMVQSIAVDPAAPWRAFVATNVGLYGTADGGDSWYLYDYGLASSATGGVNVASVVFNPVDDSTLYATTTLPHYLYKSTDGAQSWQLLSPGSSGEQAAFPGWTIAVAQAPGGKDLYVVDPNAYLLKSSDGGTTWQQLAAGLDVARQITIDPSNPSRIYILDNFGVERSTDGGQTFTNITPSNIHNASGEALALDPSTGALYLADYLDIYMSDDQGVTWKLLGAFSGAQAMLGLSGRVLVGQSAPSVPYVVKWNSTGDRMLYSTFFGGSLSDSIKAIGVDAQGEAIVAGSAYSPDFPVTRTISGPSPAGMANGFVAKLSADGRRLVDSTILGASKGATVNALAVDSSGAVYFTGQTASPDFPTTPGALEIKLPSAACQRNVDILLVLPSRGVYAFVSKLSRDASALAYSTFLAGSCGSAGEGIAVDSVGEAIVAGSTESTDFPATPHAYQPAFPGPASPAAYPNPLDTGFVTKLNAAGSQVVASTFVGGGYETEANALALDSSGNVYVTGSTWGIATGATAGAYQTKVDNNCAPVFSIGPSFGPYNGNDAFLLKLDPALSGAQFLTYLGGGCSDFAYSIVLDSSGNPWIGGSTVSPDFPLKSPFVGRGASSNFVSQLSADGTKLLFSSYSDGASLAADPAGKVYVAGTSYYLPGPKQTGSLAYLAELDALTNPPVTIDSIEHSSPFSSPPPVASFEIGAIAPGELVRIRGQHLGPSRTVNTQLDAAGRLPLVAGATRVYFGPYLAPLISIQDSLIVCFAPFEISGAATVTVVVDGQTSNAVRVGVQPADPQILAITNQDGTANSAERPAPQGSVVTLWVTGLGQTDPLSVDGMINVAPLPVPLLPVMTFIQSHPVQPQFVAAAWGLVAGISQVNLPVPVTSYPPNPVGIYLGPSSATLYIGP